MDSKSAMRGFDSLPADVRAALHEVPMPVSKARRLVKLNPADAAAIIMAKHHDALAMQRTFTMQLEFRGAAFARAVHCTRPNPIHDTRRGRRVFQGMPGLKK
jgi:hypothetical protein